MFVLLALLSIVLTQVLAANVTVGVDGTSIKISCDQSNLNGHTCNQINQFEINCSNTIFNYSVTIPVKSSKDIYTIQLGGLFPSTEYSAECCVSVSPNSIEITNLCANISTFPPSVLNNSAATDTVGGVLGVLLIILLVILALVVTALLYPRLIQPRMSKNLYLSRISEILDRKIFDHLHYTGTGTTAVAQTTSHDQSTLSARNCGHVHREVPHDQPAKEQLDAEYSVLEPVPLNPAGYEIFESATNYSEIGRVGVYSSVGAEQEATNVYQNAPNYDDMEYEVPIDVTRSADQGTSEDYSHLAYP